MVFSNICTDTMSHVSQQRKEVELHQQLDKSTLSMVTDACGSWIDSVPPISTGSEESSPSPEEISFNCQQELVSGGDGSCPDENQAFKVIDSMRMT